MLDSLGFASQIISIGMQQEKLFLKLACSSGMPTHTFGEFLSQMSTCPA